jgi:hypothetical protein
LEGVVVSSSGEGYVSGIEEVNTVGTNDTDKSWQPKHVRNITEHSTGAVDHHSLLGSFFQHSSQGGSVNASRGGVSASKEEINSRAAGAPQQYSTAMRLCFTLTQFWQSYSGMRCVIKSQAAWHGCANCEVYNEAGLKPYLMLPTCKGEMFRKLFRRALTPFLAGPSTVHGTLESTAFLIDLVSDPYVLSEQNIIAFLAKLVKNIPKQDWQAGQQMMGTSTSEAFPKKTSAFWEHFPLPEKQQCNK